MSSEGSEKVDVNRMLSVIPPASAVYSRQSRATERRVKLIYDANVNEGSLRLAKKLATQLGISSDVEVAVGGKLRIKLAAVIDDSIDDDTTVWANPDEMKVKGIADGSMVTVRAPR